MVKNSGLMKGKCGVILGVANNRSIARVLRNHAACGVRKFALMDISRSKD